MLTLLLVVGFTLKTITVKTGNQNLKMKELEEFMSQEAQSKDGGITLLKTKPATPNSHFAVTKQNKIKVIHTPIIG
jgi:hypothetical protein